uniref:Class III cytochrome C domain-containing protein n=1 Tax=Desulfobacca acetoxidans TaxID=60893 RepID=A0A7V4G7Y7_9BACT
MRCGRGFTFALLLLWGLGAWGATGPQTPPPESLLSLFGPGRGEKPPVVFSHERHPKPRLACEQCHHDYQGRRNLWREGQPVKKCSACHGLRPQARRLDLKTAFHRQCKGCHLALRRERRAGGPVNCDGCHRRR